VSLDVSSLSLHNLVHRDKQVPRCTPELVMDLNILKLNAALYLATGTLSPIRHIHVALYLGVRQTTLCVQSEREGGKIQHRQQSSFLSWRGLLEAIKLAYDPRCQKASALPAVLVTGATVTQRRFLP